MIPVTRQPEPAAFHGDVRIPGVRCAHERVGLPSPYPRASGSPCKRLDRFATSPGTLDGLTSAELSDHWTAAIPMLLDAYQRVCAYTGFWIPAVATPSVDHLVPKAKDPTLAYEWSNFRLASARFNAYKGATAKVIDPFDVKPGWFALVLGTGEVVPGDGTDADPTLRDRVQATIDQLHLNRDEALLLDRQRDFDDYMEGELGFRRLQRTSPFVAAEVLRQGRQRPEP